MNRPSFREWVNECVADALYWLGVKPGVSTGICGSTTYGYGKLDPNGYWQYPVYNAQCRARRGTLRCTLPLHPDGQHRHESCRGGRVFWKD